METTNTEGGAREAARAVTEQGSEVAATAADQARQVAGTAADEARAVVSTAGEQLATVAGEAVDQARNLLEESKAQARGQAEQQTERIASSLRHLGDQLRALTEGRVEEAGLVGDYARQAADTVGRYAGRIEQRGLDGVVHDVQRFARRRPGMFLFGALAAGFGVGRLFKANAAAGASDGGRPQVEGLDVPVFPPADAMATTASAPPLVAGDDTTVVGLEPPLFADQPPAGATS